MNLVSQSTLMVSAEVHPEVIIRMVGSATKLEGVEWGSGGFGTRQSNPGQSSSTAATATHLCAEGSRRKKGEKCRRSLRGSS